MSVIVHPQILVLLHHGRRWLVLRSKGKLPITALVSGIANSAHEARAAMWRCIPARCFFQDDSLFVSAVFMYSRSGLPMVVGGQIRPSGNVTRVWPVSVFLLSLPCCFECPLSANEDRLLRTSTFLPKCGRSMPKLMTPVCSK